MLEFIIAAALQLSARPDPFVLPGEQAAYEEFLRRQALGSQQRWTGERCETATISEISSQPLERDQFPVRRERLRLVGCGRATIINLDVARLGGTPAWRIRDSAPGETRLYKEIQDALSDQMRRQIVSGQGVSCGEVFLDDTYVAANPGHVDFGPVDVEHPETDGEPRMSIDLGADFNSDGLRDLPRAWVEVWQFRGCGEPRPLLVVLMPTVDGHLVTSYSPMWEGGVDPESFPRRAAPAP